MVAQQGTEIEERAEKQRKAKRPSTMMRRTGESVTWGRKKEQHPYMNTDTVRTRYQ